MDPRNAGNVTYTLNPVTGELQIKESLQTRMMRARIMGLKVHLCPFQGADGENCPEEGMDQNGYCKHLIGFSRDGVWMERRARRHKDGREIVSVKERQQIKKSDVQVRIGTTIRVYRQQLDAMAEAMAPPVEVLDEISAEV